MTEAHEELLAAAVKAHEDYLSAVAKAKRSRQLAFSRALGSTVSTGELAERLGMTGASVSRIANGKQ